MVSIKQVGDSDLYTMRFQQDYALDKALSSEIRNGYDLLNFICDEMFFGIRVDANLEKDSCSAFVTPTPDGKYLAGRNFGLGGSDTLCVYTAPRDGYASYSMVSTDMLNVGANAEIQTTDLAGRAILLAAPYLCVDGMNEKGLCASLLDVGYQETHMDTGKPDLLVSIAVRLLMDRAATVDEAVKLLEGFDIHTAHGASQHIFICDASGKGAIVEWRKNKMRVAYNTVCTNFYMTTELARENPSGYCERFDLLTDAMKKQPTNTAEDAMHLLEDVKQEIDSYVFTEWSVVYHLTDFTLDVALNMDYDNVYTLTKDDF